MIVVTGTDFRARQSVYINAAYRGEDVIVKSRAGNFQVVPVSDEKIAEHSRDFASELRGALIEAHEAHEGRRTLNTLDTLIHELRN